ncbi:hypothetical protein D6D15_04074 [Aureobasidium pullulans]|uniref:Uncharacterized protein n=1 Tax=Aureobasidium pullulans TaxID=5580 RepID=A0A4V6TB02_AURPU|nr:hypothetical protein D6D15_04074 [Aureobasidium pullulans]
MNISSPTSPPPASPPQAARYLPPHLSGAAQIGKKQIPGKRPVSPTARTDAPHYLKTTAPRSVAWAVIPTATQAPLMGITVLIGRLRRGMEGRIRLLILRLVLMLSRLSWVVVRVGVSSIMMGSGSALILRREGVDLNWTGRYSRINDGDGG